MESEGTVAVQTAQGDLDHGRDGAGGAAGGLRMIVSFCVVAYNEEEYLPSLFADICQQTYPREKIEVVLVDSGSRDRTRQLMEAFRDRESGFYGIQVLD